MANSNKGISAKATAAAWTELTLNVSTGAVSEYTTALSEVSTEWMLSSSDCPNASVEHDDSWFGSNSELKSTAAYEDIIAFTPFLVSSSDGSSSITASHVGSASSWITEEGNSTSTDFSMEVYTATSIIAGVLLLTLLIIVVLAVFWVVRMFGKFRTFAVC